MKLEFLFGGLLALLILSCGDPENPADMILVNGNIYTVQEEMPRAEALAIKGDLIQMVGRNGDVLKLKGNETKIIDLKGKFVMPGFIEGHGHFTSLGNSLMNLNFLQTKNWDEVVKMVEEKVKESKPGEWITGRGWHQEKWDSSPEPQVLGYPYHDELSAISPDNPVMLGHASGHSLFANKKAMQIAGISAETPDPVGGLVIRDPQGQPIGVFEENAEALIYSAYKEYLDSLPDEEQGARWLKGIDLAEQECLSKGITSFQDAGSKFYELERFEVLAEEGQLDLRLWVMVRHSYEQMKDRLIGFPVIGAGNNFFTCQAIKSEVDGALGSYGAWMLASYNDKQDFTGQNTTELSEVSKIAELAIQNDMQLCVHAIGDRANREVLNIFENTFSENAEKEDLRWRMEHAQHLDPEDIPRFKELGVIASMQAIHCTSDAPFVEKRLGIQRAKEGAYPWRSLLDAGAVVTNGTDAPVEDVDPIASFYASVTRKRPDTDMAFYPEQGMTREEAIYSYTMANAYAAFEEDIKGSLEEGKLADIVILSNDLINCAEEDILDTRVFMTIVGGKMKYLEEK